MDACFSDLRKFGYGMMLAHYATENRAISTNVREKSEAFFTLHKDSKRDRENKNAQAS